MPIPCEYKETIITPKMSRNVEALWTYSADVSGRSLVLPDGRCDIIVRFNVHKRTPAIPIITGPATQPYTVEFKAGERWLGIRLRPQSGIILWRQRIVEAVDTVAFGEEAIALLPKLKTLPLIDSTVNDLRELLDNDLVNENDNRLSKALDELHASGGKIRIDKLATMLDCTARQLNRNFRQNTGLTTKTYAQIVQFHRTLKLLRFQSLSIVDAAFEGGYADHAHLTRSFQRFGGFTPSDIPGNLTIPKLFT